MPSCQPCLRSGWKCDIHLFASAPNESSLNITVYATPFQTFGSKYDRQMLHYFSNQGSYDLSAFYNRRFWTKGVLQVAAVEPAVFRALVALSSVFLHRTTQHHEGVFRVNVQSLKMYGQAVRSLRKRIDADGRTTIRIALICSFLLCNFEAIAGNFEATSQYIQNGVGILKSNKLENEEEEDIDNDLLHIFQQLDLQASIFDLHWSPTLKLGHLVQTTAQRENRLSDKTTSPEAAYHELQTLLRTAISLRADAAQNKLRNRASGILLQKRVAAERNKCVSWLTNVSARSPMTETTNLSLESRMVLIQYYTTCIILDCIPSIDYGSLPSTKARFENLIGFIEETVRSAYNTKLDKVVTRTCQCSIPIELGLFPTLCLIAKYCSEERILGRVTALFNCRTMRPKAAENEDLNQQRI